MEHYSIESIIKAMFKEQKHLMLKNVKFIITMLE